MSHSPFFSLIIPTYNRADFIGKTLQSVSAQSCTDFEIIVVDDGSTDQTEEIVRASGITNLTYIYIPNSERAAARNKGIARACGQYFTFLDSDDLLEPDFFKEAKNFLEQSGFPKVAHMAYSVCDSSGNEIRRMDSLPENNNSFIVRGNPLSCIGVLMHHSLYPEYTFNEDRRLSGSEDWELWIRILAKHPLKTYPKPLAKIIDHAHRSVVNFSENELVMRKTLAVAYAMSDSAIKDKFHLLGHEIHAHWQTYVALHLAISGKKWRSIKYLIFGMLLSKTVIVQRRTLAILKLLILR